jgi:hypothetical protein
MSRTFDIKAAERGYRRNGLFAIELLDPVTLERVSDGLEVKADGLAGVARVNAGGLFVWLEDKGASPTKVSVGSRQPPYDDMEIVPADLNLPPADPPLTSIELRPRVDYPLPAGATAVRGTLTEDPGAPATPVPGALIRLDWLDDDGVTWHAGRPLSRTNAGGDFLAILRLSPADLPQLDAAGCLTVRLHVTRGQEQRQALDFKLAQGRVADPTTVSALIAAWNDLQP